MAWTPEQYQLAEQLLDNISALSLAMRQHVQNFQTGLTASITLTADQKQELIDLYAEGKRQLSLLWEQLPDT